MTPTDIADMKLYIAAQRSVDTRFDIVVEGETPGDDPEQAASIVRPYADAGVTWWIESVWHTPETQGGVEGMCQRIQQGPPNQQ